MKSIRIFFFLTFLFLTNSSSAKIIHVPNEVASIQDGINLAAFGDTVLVAEGRYYENINFRGKAITLASHFVLDGRKSHIKHTIIDGSKPANPDTASTVLFLSREDSLSLLTGFSITGGQGTDCWTDPFWPSRIEGGGILCKHKSSPKITHNIIYGNQADCGGGLYAEASGLTVENCSFLSNQSLAGGGVYGLGTMIFKKNLFKSNKAKLGGGIFYSTVNQVHWNSYNPDILIFQNVFISNHAIDRGGAIAHPGKIFTGGFTKNESINDHNIKNYKVKIIDNIIDANYAGKNGAGISCSNWSSLIEGNLIINNITENGNGGGIFCYIYSHPHIINNTFFNNYAHNGGGIYKQQAKYTYPPPGFPLILNNSITHSKGNWGIYHEGDSALIISNNVWNNEGGNISINTGFTNMSKDPQYVNPSNNNFRLKPFSPCIDAGTDFVAIGGDTLFAIDESEYFGIAPDIGAFESRYRYLFQDDLISNYRQDQLDIKEFRLNNNYPNPFNPSTKICFTLPAREHVTLEVYSPLGQKLVTLLNKQLHAGRHEVEFNATNLSSGIFFYRIEAGEFQQVKKMFFVK